MTDALKDLLAKLQAGAAPPDLSQEAIADNGRVENWVNKTPAITTGLNTEDLAIRRPTRAHCLNLDGIAAAAKQIGSLPEPGWSIHCIMGGDYHGFDVVPTICELEQAPITRLTIATLSFSKRNLSHLCLLLDQKRIEAVELLASDYFAKADAAIYTAAARELDNRGQRIGFARTHAKVICATTAKGNDYVVESSANLRSCVNFEQFAIFNDAALLQWHREWITYLLSISPKT